MLRVTPDVNILVSGTLFRRGASGEILAAWQEEKLALVTCETIVAQYEDVLRSPRIQRKYNFVNNHTVGASAAALRTYSILAEPVKVPPVCRDPDDDIVLACAVMGQADYIISGDQDLLVLNTHEGIPIVTPRGFVTILPGEGAVESRPASRSTP
ncbi:MAG: putative toxin-antitoxin system toxin component, PIN family [Candidatus Methylomirabilaceae bacterium]